MLKKTQLLFKWDESGTTSDLVKFKNNKQYQIKITKIGGDFSVCLLEDEFYAWLENTSNDSFRKVVDTSKLTEHQVLEWASYILSSKIGQCGFCKERKVIQRLSKHTLLDIFNPVEPSGFQQGNHMG